MSGSPAAAACILFLAVLFAAATVPLSVFYVRVAAEYENDDCLRHLGTPDLALWLKVLGWTEIASASFCVPLLVIVAGAACKTKKSLFGLVAFVCVLVPVGLFLGAWTVVGMVRVAQAAECHKHAPELWNWSFAAVLIMTGPMLSVTVGTGSGGARRGSGGGDDD